MTKYVHLHKGLTNLTSLLLVVQKMITERNVSLEPRGRSAESLSALRMMMNVDGLPNVNENSTMSKSSKICPRMKVGPQTLGYSSLYSSTP